MDRSNKPVLKRLFHGCWLLILAAGCDTGKPMTPGEGSTGMPCTTGMACTVMSHVIQQNLKKKTRNLRIQHWQYVVFPKTGTSGSSECSPSIFPHKNSSNKWYTNDTEPQLFKEITRAIEKFLAVGNTKKSLHWVCKPCLTILRTIQGCHGKVFWRNLMRWLGAVLFTRKTSASGDETWWLFAAPLNMSSLFLIRIKVLPNKLYCHIPQKQLVFKWRWSTPREKKIPIPIPIPFPRMNQSFGSTSTFNSKTCCCFRVASSSKVVKSIRTCCNRFSWPKMWLQPKTNGRRVLVFCGLMTFGASLLWGHEE